MATKRKYVGLRIPKELKIRIKTAAAKRGLSMIGYIEQELTSYLTKELEYEKE